MQKFDWNLIRNFLAALDGGSLAEAARTTKISQPTLGRHIDELEKVLGVTLFERGRMGMMPTKAALHIADAAREMKAASASLTMAAEENAQSVEGTVRITASEVVSTYILPQIISELLRDLPQIQIELAPSNAVENLLQRDADIAIRMVRPTQNDLITRKVNDMQMGIFADRTYLERQGPVTDFESLAGHTIIGYDRNDLILQGFNRAGFKIDRHFFRFRCDDQVAAMEALIVGTGIGFAPRVLARKYANLVEVLHGFPLPALPMWLTSHRELNTSARIRAVNDYIGEQLAKLDLA